MSRRPNGDSNGMAANGNPAERFENEKNRIIESCFLKKEEDGAYAESYITHIPVYEDASSPSSPPPLTSDPKNKKPRVIIVAVRRSGRVRLHKARENSNNSFSIGKTWQLDHLTAIESFTGLGSYSPEEQQRKNWAGPTGMLITIQKPYFWQAGTQKEKDFFIGSLVKIFKKYTGGKEPILSGFAPQELSAFAHNGARPKTPQSQSQASSSMGMNSSPSASPSLRPPIPTPSLGSDRSLAGRPSSSHREGRLRPSADGASSQDSLMSSQREFSTPPLGPSVQSRERKSPLPPPPSHDNSQLSPDPRIPQVPPMRSPERPRAGAHSPVRSPMRPPERSAARPPSRQEPQPEIPVPEALPERRRPPIDSTISAMTNFSEASTAIPQSETPEPILSPTDSGLDSPAIPEEPREAHRPGLGPMIKKRSGKELAGRFRQAAAAANAFKPRVGGAGDRLRSEGNKLSSADGINGVFPAPAREGPKSPLPATPTTATIPGINEDKQDDIVAKPGINRFASSTPDIKEPQRQAVPSPGPEKARLPEKSTSPPEEKKKKQPSTHYMRYAKAVGIDPILLEGRTADIESVFTEVGWGEDEKTSVSYDELQNRIRRDLAKIETGSWLGSLEAGDERVGEVDKLLGKAIAECDQLDSVLTLYNVELGTLYEDVAYIEAQEQGLQVQTANQRLLYTELQNLGETISVSSGQLRPLQDEILSRPEGLQVIEGALVQLYKAMLTIDPNLKLHGRPQSSDSKSTGSAVGTIGAEVSGMRAVREKKQGYENKSNAFVQRFRDHMTSKFDEYGSLTRSDLSRSRATGANTKMNKHARNAAREILWPYSPILLYVRELARSQWESLILSYEGTAKSLYQNEFRDDIGDWKSAAKKPAGDHEDILFTHQEKEPESTGSLVGRKLTVKRSRNLREGPKGAEKYQDGKIPGYEAFAGALTDTSAAIAVEQNFISDFFHVSGLNNLEFTDLVAATEPGERKGTNLESFRQFDPDRNMAKRLQSIMDDMFSFWAVEIQNFVDWIIIQDPLQGVGVIYALESNIHELESSHHEYAVQALQQIHGRLNTRFDRFVEEQLRGIEDTKVKIKKRKGVISFIKTFPFFVAAVEQMLPGGSYFDIREKVNKVYGDLNRAMFESLKFIAKESPMVMAGQKGQAAADSEDKEVLNYHILLIQNMNHYVEEVQPLGNPELETWFATAQDLFKEHMDQYVGAVIRRPLGKLLEAVESIETLLKVHPNEPPTAVAQKPSHSRSLFKKLLSDFDAKDVRHKIDTLKKRVEKHFGEADDANLSRNLVVNILRECETRYVDILIRTNRIVRDVYEGDLEVEFKRDDIQQAFKRA